MNIPCASPKCPRDRWIGESSEPMEFVGMFRYARDREILPTPRSTWRCDKCGWIVVYQPLRAASSWRHAELKTGS